MSSRDRVPDSFRDPSGFVFYHDGRLYRRIEIAYREHYDRLLHSGLHRELVDADLLIPHREAEMETQGAPTSYKVIEPERIPFVSYPYEWSFSQLRDAALATLDIQKRALKHGISLKDSSAYNIQFRQGKPVLIDTLSFEAYREGEPWIAYRQFCQHFLAPLSLMSHRDIRLNQLLRVYIDGIPLDLSSALLPARSRLSFPLLVHIHLHALSQRRFAARTGTSTHRTMSRISFLGLIDSLEGAIRRLKWRPGGTEWVNYVEEANYTARAMQHKGELVSRFLDQTESRIVWDLGANTGSFSRLAAHKGSLVISADSDPACVEANYLRCLEEDETNILPLLIDLTNPSPGLGWATEERMSLVERGPADSVLALAILHHLAITNNLPFARIADFLSRICRWLVIERYCQILWIGTPSAASIQGMGMNGSFGSRSHFNISASPFGNSTPALTRATR